MSLSNAPLDEIQVTPEMMRAGARALVALGLLPCEFGSDNIAETIFEEMIEASPYKLAAKATTSS
jgi:hypothetical protein